MTNHKKVRDEEKADDAVRGKRPYETPTLTKLGTVKQVTQGTPNVFVPDTFGASL